MSGWGAVPGIFPCLELFGSFFYGSEFDKSDFPVMIIIFSHQKNKLHRKG